MLVRVRTVFCFAVFWVKAVVLIVFVHSYLRAVGVLYLS